MFGIKNRGGQPSFGELAGVILSEKALMGIMQPKFDRKIRHITVDGSEFTLNFDDSESVNAYLLKQKDIVRMLGEYYGRTVIDIGLSESGHEQYMVRFEE